MHFAVAGRYFQMVTWKFRDKWHKVFKNVPSKCFGRQPLKSLKGCGLL